MTPKNAKINETHDDQRTQHQSEQDLSLQEIQEDIEEIEPEFLDDLPPEQRKKFLSLVRTISIRQASMHSGPLPRPEDIEKYNMIIPNGAERIMKEAELQSAHRRSMENKVIDSDNKQSAKGQIFGLVISLICIGGAISLGLLDQPWLGGILATTTVIGLVTVYVLGKSAQFPNNNNEPE
ncbi:hypothetical protein IQ37_15190 [Chryseobacterium piperi]|uniref:DUF2335 domain-containing protein n=1 Tax=Chryseobacterium piperi TaxID=558152 RepID=A0A086AXG8_9FLAO|nr:DUF2335 domain-containing protein [Chryseobacterium piperi]ASW74697.1 DUF2335 domain-containing protein [Chryseobacterium piperi]KFF21382.1 hypothetical protein IQ37_15190 [Chryseobacterium piperi]